MSFIEKSKKSVKNFKQKKSKAIVMKNKNNEKLSITIHFSDLEVFPVSFKCVSSFSVEIFTIHSFCTICYLILHGFFFPLEKHANKIQTKMGKEKSIQMVPGSAVMVPNDHSEKDAKFEKISVAYSYFHFCLL